MRLSRCCWGWETFDNLNQAFQAAAGSWLKDIGSTRPTTVVIYYASFVGYARVRCCGFGAPLLGDLKMHRSNQHEREPLSYYLGFDSPFGWSRSIVPVSRDWWHARASLAARSIMYMHSVLGCTSAGSWERAAACASRAAALMESSCMVRIHFVTVCTSRQTDVAHEHWWAYLDDLEVNLLSVTSLVFRSLMA